MKDKIGTLKETLKLIRLCQICFIAVASYYVILRLFPQIKEIGFLYNVTSILAVMLLVVAFAGLIVANMILKKAKEKR